MSKLLFNFLQWAKLLTELGSVFLFKAISQQESLSYFSWKLFLIGNCASTLSHVILFFLSFGMVHYNTLRHPNLLAGPSLILALVSFNVVSQLLIRVTVEFPFVEFQADRNLTNLPYMLSLGVAIAAIYISGLLRWS